MAYSIGWSPRAIADVDAIAGYISRDSATYASTIVSKILGATRNLGRNGDSWTTGFVKDDRPSLTG